MKVFVILPHFYTFSHSCWAVSPWIRAFCSIGRPVIRRVSIFTISWTGNGWTRQRGYPGSPETRALLHRLIITGVRALITITDSDFWVDMKPLRFASLSFSVWWNNDMLWNSNCPSCRVRRSRWIFRRPGVQACLLWARRTRRNRGRIILCIQTIFVFALDVAWSLWALWFFLVAISVAVGARVPIFAPVMTVVFAPTVLRPAVSRVRIRIFVSAKNTVVFVNPR